MSDAGDAVALRERIVQFGERRRLTGTLTEAHRAATGFILLNAGVISRVGPQRLNVTLARALAQLGYPALRFDLAGLGESRAAGGTASFEAQAVADVREAIELLSREASVERVVLVGLCSGADNAYAAALADARVHGVVLLDPYAYPTLGSRIRAHLLRLERPGRLASIGRALRRAAAKLGTALAALAGRRAQYDPAGEDGRTVPSAAEFRRGLTALVARGVHGYLMYSGSVTPTYNHDDQFARVFGRELATRLRVEYQPAVNHTRTELAAQRDFVARVTRWAAEKFGTDLRG